MNSFVAILCAVTFFWAASASADDTCTELATVVEGLKTSLPVCGGSDCTLEKPRKCKVNKKSVVCLLKSLGLVDEDDNPAMAPLVATLEAYGAALGIEIPAKANTNKKKLKAVVKKIVRLAKDCDIE